MIEAELRREATRKNVRYQITPGSLNQLVGLMMSENLEIRYSDNGSDFVDEVSRIIQWANPELTGFLNVIRSSESIPVFSNWENFSVAREGGTFKQSVCRNAEDECVFLDTKTSPRQFGSYWSEMFASLEPTLVTRFKTKGEVLQLLKQMNQNKFGDFSDWRFPSPAEVEEAISHQLADVIEQVPMFGNLLNDRELNVWTSGLDDRSGVEDGKNYPLWVYDLKKKALRLTRYENDKHAWIFVRNKVSQYWEDGSTLSDQITPTQCQLWSDSCVLKHKKTGAFISEISPGTENSDGFYHVLASKNRGSCQGLNAKGWGGRRNWQDIVWKQDPHHPVSRVFQQMVDDGLGRVAMMKDRLRLNLRPIWTSGVWLESDYRSGPVWARAQSYHVVTQELTTHKLYIPDPNAGPEPMLKVSWACIALPN